MSDDLADEKTLHDLDVLGDVWVGAPVVVPFPVTSTEDFLCHLHGHTCRGVGDAAGQLVAVAQAGLEIVGEVVKGALPRARSGAKHRTKLGTELTGHREVIIPLGGRLQLVQCGTDSAAGIALVDGVDRGDHLVQRQGAIVVGPDSTKNGTGRALGQGGLTGTEPDTVVGLIGDEAQLLAIDIPEILAVLVSILNTADGDLGILTGAIHTRREWVGGILVRLSVHGHGLDATLAVSTSIEVRANIVALVSLVLEEC